MMKEKWELYHDTVISFGDGGIDVRNAPKAKERAKLIAAAPALLEALEGVMSCITILTESNDRDVKMIAHMDLSIMRDKARAAIAAAKGE